MRAQALDFAAVAAVVVFVAAAGCAGNARVDLAAADALDSLAAATRTALVEYHDELEAADSRRESAAIDAFIARIRRDNDDEQLCAAHAAAFKTALARVREDRHVELERYRAALDNADTAVEVADGLRRLAVQSLTLEDETRRYLLSLLETVHPANEPVEESATVGGGDATQPDPNNPHNGGTNP